jgi:hypothetical protein
MSIAKIGIVGAVMLIGTTIAAPAQQTGYPADAYYPPYPVPAPPPAWNYDPYTSGLGACLNWTPGDLPCRERIQPTFGQPNYRPVR